MLVLEVVALLLVLLALLITLLAEPLHGVAHASVSLVDLPALPPLDGLIALKAVSDTCVADRIALAWLGSLAELVIQGGPERVNEFETPGSRIQAWSVSVFGGGLIHAAIGLAGGLGVALTKRCGFSVKARSRTV